MSFLVITLKHILGHTSHANLPRTPKLWAIDHQTAIKHENNKFLVIYLKHVASLARHKNLPRAPKLWAIAHEKGHKTQKRRVFW
jgi:hypothetical protein